MHPKTFSPINVALNRLIAMPVIRMQDNGFFVLLKRFAIYGNGLFDDGSK